MRFLKEQRPNEHGKVWILRAKKDAEPGTSFSLLGFTLDGFVTSVNGLDSVEDYLLSIPFAEVDGTSSTGITPEVFSILVARATNKVAQSTRRSTGNILVMNKTDINLLGPTVPVNSISFSDKISPGAALVIYYGTGEYDVPFVVSGIDSGKLGIFTTTSEETAHEEDYGCWVKF
jgi:hypothetical protein